MFILPWIAQAAGIFAVRQVAKYGMSVNWSSVRSDVQIRVKQLIPGEMLDKAGADIAGEVVDKIQTLVTSGDALAQLVKFATDGNWAEAWEFIESATLVKTAACADVPKDAA